MEFGIAAELQSGHRISRSAAIVLSPNHGSHSGGSDESDGFLKTFYILLPPPKRINKKTSHFRHRAICRIFLSLSSPVRDLFEGAGVRREYCTDCASIKFHHSKLCFALRGIGSLSARSHGARGGKAYRNWRVLPESMLVESRSLTLHHRIEQHSRFQGTDSTPGNRSGRGACLLRG